MKLLATLAACLVFAACGSDPEGTTGAPSEEAEPTRIELIAHDFGFEIADDTVPAGTMEAVMVNEGKQPHQALFYRLNDGVDFESFKKKVMQDDSLLPQLAEPGPNGLSKLAGPGEEIASATDELEPGEYAVVCFVIDQSMKTDKNHAELGMIQRLTVE